MGSWESEDDSLLIGMFAGLDDVGCSGAQMREGYAAPAMEEMATSFSDSPVGLYFETAQGVMDDLSSFITEQNLEIDVPAAPAPDRDASFSRVVFGLYHQSSASLSSYSSTSSGESVRTEAAVELLSPSDGPFRFTWDVKDDGDDHTIETCLETPTNRKRNLPISCDPVEKATNKMARKSRNGGSLNATKIKKQQQPRPKKQQNPSESKAKSKANTKSKAKAKLKTSTGDADLYIPETSSNRSPRARGERVKDTSFFRGVSCCGKDRKWQARIRELTKVRYLGRFSTELEAALVYDNAARAIKGKEAQTNFLEMSEKDLEDLKQAFEAKKHVPERLFHLISSPRPHAIERMLNHARAQPKPKPATKSTSSEEVSISTSACNLSLKKDSSEYQREDM